MSGCTIPSIAMLFANCIALNKTKPLMEECLSNRIKALFIGFFNPAVIVEYEGSIYG